MITMVVGILALGIGWFGIVMESVRAAERALHRLERRISELCWSRIGPSDETANAWMCETVNER